MFFPLRLRPTDPPLFPDPRGADDEGLVAIGGDLGAARLLAAYDHGIFPWYPDGPPLWWCPDPRAVLTPQRLHVSRSMRRQLRQLRWRISWNSAFEAVMRACAERREGTWILPEMLTAYVRLHELGHAHSVEVWDGAELVGGLYGVQRGACFAAESMFHRQTNASKVALIGAVTALGHLGVTLLDVQFLTEHLQSLGAFELSRDDYLDQLAVGRTQPVDLQGLTQLDTLALVHSGLA